MPGKLPKKKESIMTMAEAPHEKHMYSRERKRMVQALEGFDPHPAQFRGTAHYYIPGPLKKICGECICTSSVFDEHYHHWNNTAIIPAHHHHQSVAIQQYLRHQQSQGHPNSTVAPCGFYVCKSNPYLGGSPDDASQPSAPFGLKPVQLPGI